MTAVLSHTSALALWGLIEARGPVHVTVDPVDKGKRNGMIIHRRRSLGEKDVTTVDGIPTTTLPRTMLDYASLSSARRSSWIEQLERVAAEAHRSRRLDIEALLELSMRAGGLPGITAFRRLLSRLDDQVLVTRSGGERHLLRLLRRSNVTGFEVNAMVGPHEVDFLWRSERVVVEYDGYAYHSDSRSFDRDHRRDAELKSQGYEILRVTYRMMTEDPQNTVRTVRALLARAG